ncbi:MAG TPA: sulfotransferase domain-containing protein [Verrucomicrobiae bacterium]|nr:sulfotransferase domain-containing protein [Verrucomicrobiae bacterium]
MPDPSTFKKIRPFWLASYPRSGNTFLRILLQNVFQLSTYSVYLVEDQNYTDPSADALGEAAPLPKNWTSLVSDDPDAQVVIIKTHEPKPDQAPAIYVVRDGRAAVDSYFHYHQKFTFDKPSLTEVIAGACQFGSWSAHYLAWSPRTRPRTLFLKYEDLVARPTELIPQLADFLSVKPIGDRIPTFDELKQRSPSFFRRGMNADYLSKWSSGQMALFNLLHGSVMEDLGYPLTLVPPLQDETIVELARGAARLHALYLENLGKVGASWTQCRQLAEEAKSLREAQPRLDACERDLKLLQRRVWVRLGAALGLVPKLSQPFESRPVLNSSKRPTLPEPV